MNRAERLAYGRSLRLQVPRSTHAQWTPDGREDPVAILRRNDEGRLPELVPVRHQRMSLSPFAFYRGGAAIMAADLAQTPTTSLHVQLGGDCHLLNFGGYATPERNLVFDVNDFDETLRGPWDWDVKRLSVSVVLAAREIGMRAPAASDAVVETVRSYRERMNPFAQQSPLEIWYTRIDASRLVGRPQNPEHLLPKLTEIVDGRRRFVDDPPFIYHLPHGDPLETHTRARIAAYRRNLRVEVCELFDHYRFVDAAIKVVGIGSVGTRCAVALFTSADDEPLMLQVKEARRSVLEPFVAPSPFKNQGERVVTGQRKTQAASDVFLGWLRDDEGHDYYVRQLRDMKISVKLDALRPAQLVEYATTCAWALARAHARTGDPAAISGYLGRSDRFDEAIVRFARSYADQVERDFEAFKKAVAASGGR
jgi:uncharacterized protein (DUF2252 family)